MSDIQRYGFGDVDAEESCADIYPQSSGMYVRYADHRAKVAALEADLTLKDCKVCGGSGRFQDSTEGGIWAGCHCWRNRVLELREKIKTLEAENGRLRAERRATLEAVIDECSAEKVYAITGRMLTAYRAQQPNPAQDKEQG